MFSTGWDWLSPLRAGLGLSHNLMLAKRSLGPNTTKIMIDKK